LARSVRDAYFHTLDAFVPCPVYERDDFAPGMSLSGPAIVEQMDTTTIVPPDFDAKADPWGNLILTRTR
jgi:N-methylhydantoinase A